MSDRIPFHDAVRRQPSLLQTAATAITRSLADAEVAPWRPGDTVAVVAMGASTHSGYALTAALTQQGVRAVNLTASELVAAPASFEPADHYLLVSESGRSPEPIAAARTRGAGRRIAITNFPDAAVSEVADLVVGYGGIDDSHVYTSGYLATLMSYAALMDAAGLASGFDVRTAADLVGDTIARTEAAIEAAAQRFADVRDVDFIGRGFAISSATQGALIFREALRLATSGWETYQYLHGPLESAGRSSAIVVIGDGRELDVIPQLAAGGVQVLALTSAPDRVQDHENVVVVPVTAPEGFARTVEETVILQLLADAIARLRGITIEDFLYSQPDTKLPKPGETAETAA